MGDLSLLVVMLLWMAFRDNKFCVRGKRLWDVRESSWLLLKFSSEDTSLVVYQDDP